jgi:hypothetical protein
MKKLIYAFLAVTIFISACSEENIVTKESLLLTDFKEAGEIHNKFLTNVKSNFHEIKSIESVEGKVAYINDFNRSFVASLDLEEREKQMLLDGLDQNKQLVRTEVLTAEAFHQNKSGRVSSEEANLFQTIEALRADGLISEFGYNLLNQYGNDVKSNYNGSLTDAMLKRKTLGYISEFESHAYATQSGEGQMIGNILAISIASIEWWEANPDAFEYNTENGRVLIAPWAAADIVGAAWGGATGAIGSYAGTGEVNWTAVGVGALSGAIAGSTGAVGKIAKWLF